MVVTSGRDAALQASLLAWYDRAGRALPWRGTHDPYAVLVSEVMLQQTQVSRVVPRFEAWLGRWPTAEALAAAPAHEVLGEWSGLGYNSRALRLHTAAKVVAEQGWPADEAGLRALPGVGDYTAGAVAAFAFGLPAAAVDTNQARVLNRWDGAVGRPARELRHRALALVPAEAPGDWNHALMDLGATICTARVAACDRCPMANECASTGLVDVAAERAMRGQAPAGDDSAPKARFEETQRYVRGRVVAVLVERGALDRRELSDALPAGIAPDRLVPALRSLLTDGLVVESPAGLLALPS